MLLDIHHPGEFGPTLLQNVCLESPSDPEDLDHLIQMCLQFFSTAYTHFPNFASFFSKLYTQIQELHAQNASHLLQKWSTAFKIKHTHLKS